MATELKTIYKWVKKWLRASCLDLIMLSAKQNFSFPDHKNYVSSANKGHCVDVEGITLKLWPKVERTFCKS